MKSELAKIILIFLLLTISTDHPSGQSGGTFEIPRSVVASGGGVSSGQGITIVGTAGQAAAGEFSSSAQYGLTSGFWTDTTASITGRVINAQGRGIRNAQMTLTNSVGEVRAVITGPVGMYKFVDVPLGQTYTLRVQSRRFTFAQPVQTITLNGNLSDVNFTSNN